MSLRFFLAAHCRKDELELNSGAPNEQRRVLTGREITYMQENVPLI